MFNLKDPNSMMLIAGLVLVGFWFMMRVNRRKPKDSVASLTAEEQIERLRQSRGMQGDLHTLMDEIERLTERVGKQLETRQRELDRLLREADERIARLEKLQGGAGRDDPPAPLRFPPGKTAGPSALDDPLSRSVYELADAGHGSVEIARRLNEQVGKVELILALRRA